MARDRPSVLPPAAMIMMTETLGCLSFSWCRRSRVSASFSQAPSRTKWGARAPVKRSASATIPASPTTRTSGAANIALIPARTIAASATISTLMDGFFMPGPRRNSVAPLLSKSSLRCSHYPLDRRGPQSREVENRQHKHGEQQGVHQRTRESPAHSKTIEKPHHEELREEHAPEAEKDNPVPQAHHGPALAGPHAEITGALTCPARARCPCPALSW